MKAGKKTKEWDSVRRKLIRQFIQWQIFTCELNYEGCWREIQGFAHKKKRRKLSTSELFEVIGVCNVCHDKIEYLPAEEMERIIEEVIKNRHNSLLTFDL